MIIIIFTLHVLPPIREGKERRQGKEARKASEEGGKGKS